METCPNCKKEIEPVKHIATSLNGDLYYEEVCPNCQELLREGS